MSGPGSTHPETHTHRSDEATLTPQSACLARSLRLRSELTIELFYLAHTFTHKHTPTLPERALTHLAVRSVSLGAGLNGPASHFSQPVLPLQSLQAATSSHTHIVNMSDSRTTSRLIPRQSLANDDGTKTYFSGAF